MLLFCVWAVPKSWGCLDHFATCCWKRRPSTRDPNGNRFTKIRLFASSECILKFIVHALSRSRLQKSDCIANNHHDRNVHWFQQAFSLGVGAKHVSNWLLAVWSVASVLRETLRTRLCSPLAFGQLRLKIASVQQNDEHTMLDKVLSVPRAEKSWNILASRMNSDEFGTLLALCPARPTAQAKPLLLVFGRQGQGQPMQKPCRSKDPDC